MIKAILNFLFKLFKKSWDLPHPEESTNYNNGSTVNMVKTKWLTDWNVCNPNRWKLVPVFIKNDIPVPAWTYNGIIEVKSEWLNPGVIAHEMAHISYADLSESDKVEFGSTWRIYKTQYYMSLISSKLQGNDIESHAEIYRYLGDKMPNELKYYYPNLLKGERTCGIPMSVWLMALN